MHGNIPYMFEGCSSPSITKGLQNTVLRLTESNQTHNFQISLLKPHSDYSDFAATSD